MTLIEDELVVEPGGEVVAVVRVRNTSDVITEFDLTVLGEVAAYTQIVPAQLSVYVGDAMEATVYIRPPYDTMISSGQIPFAVRAQSREDSGRVGLAEGELTVGAINLLQTKVLPSQSSGRWRAKARLEIENQGTEEMTVRLRTVDPDEKLRFALAPREFDVAPGATADAFLKIRPRKSMIVGTAVQVPFQVSYRRKAGLRDAYQGATTGGETEAFVSSSFTQKPILARWMMGAFLLAVVLSGLFIWRAQTTEIDATPAAPVTAESPPTNVRIEPGIGTLRVEWDAATPTPDGYRLISLDPRSYADGRIDPVEEPEVTAPLGALEQSIELAVEEGATKCLFIQSVSTDGGPRSVIVGPASPSGLSPADLPIGNCVEALGRDICDDPVIESIASEGDLNNPRTWTLIWSYDEECETKGDAVWTIVINGTAQDPITDATARTASLDFEGMSPIEGVFTVIVSPREGSPGDQVTVSADEVNEEERRLVNLEQGIVSPRRNYAIVTGLNPSSGLPLTGRDSVEQWFENIELALTGPSSPFPVDRTRISFGPVVESELPDDDNSNMRLLDLAGVEDVTSYFLVVDDFASLADAQRLCNAVQSLVDGINAAFVADIETLGPTRPPDDCRTVDE